MSDPGTGPGKQSSQPRGATVLEQIGGIRGLIYSSLPVLVPLLALPPLDHQLDGTVGE